ncbi:acetyl esterase/lipase [Arthrobacter sp. CAN_A6]|uniref:alpha/beta hydrolase n=1 Tax=Arthrobacter sp. CAN_A6 TaxID=2787721 RepID=UPI001A2AF7B9
MEHPGRRTILALWAAAWAAMTAACTPRPAGGNPAESAAAAPPERYAYGGDPSQFADLYLPTGQAVRGVVVIVHGGYWRSTYGAELGEPLALDLVQRGYACWNLEYRRAGNGGGWPATFDDVAAGIDLLATAAEEHGFDTRTTAALGHSAGGHLAVWAAGRATLPAGAPGSGTPRVALRAVVTQSGVLDLADAQRLGLSNGAVENLLGTGPDGDPVRYRLADPMTAVPLDIPVYALHGEDDTTVPRSQSADYVEAARRGGAEATLTIIPGDHFAMIEPGTRAWERVVETLELALRSARV